MRKLAVPLTLAATFHAGTALAEQSPPTIHACLVAYSELEQRALYRVAIDWRGLADGFFHRLDIGIVDTGGIIWPQLRVDQLRPGPGPTEQPIMVSDVTRYPVQLLLLGFTAEAARRFDQTCEDGFCSLPRRSEGITELGEGASVSSVQQAPPCA